MPTFHNNRPTMGMDYLMHNIEANAKTFIVMRFYRPLKPRENTRLLFRSDANTAIPHRQDNHLVIPLDMDIDRLAGPILNRIRYKVRHQLLDP